MWKNLHEDAAYQRAMNEQGGMLSINTGPYAVPIGVPLRNPFDSSAHSHSMIPPRSHESPIANAYPSSPYAGNDDYTRFWKTMYNLD